MSRTVRLGDGVPCWLAYVPSPGARAAMRASLTTSRKITEEHQTAEALAYVRWLAARDGITIPKETAPRTAPRWGGCSGTRLEVEWGWVEGARPARRVQALRWVRDDETTLLRIEIPNWNHMPEVRAITGGLYAKAS